MTQLEMAMRHNERISLPKYRQTDLPCHPFSYGVEQMTGHVYKYNLTSRDTEKFVIFQYTFAGLGEIFVRGKRHLLPRGKAFLVLTPSPCTYMQSPNDELYHFIYVSISGTGAIELAQKIIGKCGSVLTIPADSQALEMLCEHFNQLAAAGAIENIYEDAVFGYKFLLTLLQEQEPNLPHTKDKIPIFLEKALAFMEQNLDNTLLDVNALAAHVHLSVFYFTRLFTEYLGCSPRRYLQAQRLFRAAQLLAGDCSVPLKAIIEQCGFSSATYFCRAFRKAYHFSPGKYRSLYKFHNDLNSGADTVKKQCPSTICKNENRMNGNENQPVLSLGQK